MTTRTLRATSVFLAALIGAAAAASAATIFVKFDAAGANDGTTWTDAYTSLQSALVAAGASDEIWVAAGTYKPTATTDRAISFALKNGVGVYGGFAGTETLRSQRDPVAHVTILSGDIGVVGNASDNSRHVVTADSTVTASGVLDGFTITGGNADGASPPDDRGGGLLIASGSPTIGRCIFAGNSAGTRGGGTRVDGGTAAFSDCRFQGNSAGLGGGAVSAGIVTTLTLTRCVILGNSAADSTRGGGIDVTNNVAAIDCLVAANSGNGVEYFQGGNSLVNTTVTGHPGYGLAILSGTSSAVNSILWGNSTAAVFSNGVLTASYTDIQGGGFLGAGNIDADPLFVNPGAHDWRLGPGSPATDAGNNAAVPGGITTDLAGLPRFFDDPAVTDTGAGAPPIVDMGAYERVPLSVTAPSPSPQSICAGAAASFSVTASGAGPLTYRWRKGGVNLSNGGSISGATTATLSIDPTATGDTGSYDVVVTDSFAQSVTSASGTLTVNAVPAAPTAGNNGPICAGQTLQLTASTVSGATYSWTGPNGFTSSLQNPSISSATTAASGIYSVTVTVNGCTSPAGTTNAVVSSTPAAPTAGNNGPICAGQTLQLTASTVASATYAWTGPDGFTSSQQNPAIVSAPVSASGIYSVTVTVGGCTSAPATTTATVHALPSAAITSPSSVCGGSSGNAASVPDAGPGASYAWIVTNGSITSGQGTSSLVFSAGPSGSVGLSVTVTDANGCVANGSKSVPTSAACLSFFSLAPCRVLDTRNPAGPLGGPALNGGATRTFLVGGHCGIPLSAKALSLNVTATVSTAAGDLRLFPGGAPLPLVSTVNYGARQTRANNAITSLGASGDLSIRCDQASGTVHAIVDVNGYFE